MVDYSNPAFVKARNAAAVRKEIESSGRSFETFAATNLTDAEIFTMTNRLKPLSMNDIKQDICQQISIIPNDCSLSDLNILNVRLGAALSLPSKVLEAFGVNDTSSDVFQGIKHDVYKRDAFDDTFEDLTGTVQGDNVYFDAALFEEGAKNKKLFTDSLNEIGQIVSGTASKRVLYPDTAPKIASDVSQLYEDQVASNNILIKLGITPTAANSNSTYVANKVQALIDAEKNFFSKIGMNPELYEKYEISDLPIKAASILNQISIYQKAKFTIDIACKRYVSGTESMSLTDAQQEFRDACIEFNSATSKTDIGNALSNVCMKIFEVSVTGNIVVVITTSEPEFDVVRMVPAMVSRACSSFTGAPTVDGNGAIYMHLDRAFTAGWTTGAYTFFNYLPDNIKLLDEIMASDYPWLTFD
ncbi:hypothetical protein [Candidatus Lariskella endosymbiont of Epinotia ramella]|uniref:hypothetical protein n=1 Tax=Candidatus Lariskella endosymbiont of Epinotia ramella TaxID=3066224 RepID=UPI0030CB12CD